MSSKDLLSPNGRLYQSAVKFSRKREDLESPSVMQSSYPSRGSWQVPLCPLALQGVLHWCFSVSCPSSGHPGQLLEATKIYSSG